MRVLEPGVQICLLPPPTTSPVHAAELRRCSSLRELNLEGNKLTTPVLDLRSLAHLQSLQVWTMCGTFRCHPHNSPY